MELVVATIGLSLGILNQQMFSIIVVVAIATTFLAPLGLRLSMRFVRVTEDEAKRISQRATKGAFDPERVRLLVPTAAGPNAIEAARLALGIAGRSQNVVEVLYVDAASSWPERLGRVLSKVEPGRGLEQHLSALRGLAQGVSEPRIRRVRSESVCGAILDVASQGFSAILMGASHSTALGGRVLEEVVTRTPCHVVIVRAGQPAITTTHYRHVLVPVDGSLISRFAVEFATRYCEATDAALTIVVQVERWRLAESLADDGAEEDETPRPTRPLMPLPTLEVASGDSRARVLEHVLAHSTSSADDADPVEADRLPLPSLIGVPVIEQTPEEELARISPLFRYSPLRPNLLHLDYDPTRSSVLDEVRSGKYDLVVVGAENRAIRHRMFFGYNNERLIRRSAVSVAVVVPKLGRPR
jgi:nucleotide-binding universal stress UspA family protein